MWGIFKQTSYNNYSDLFLDNSSGTNVTSSIEKGECVDPDKGEYQGVNASTYTRTNGMVDRIYLHSIFGYPHTACSCFQNVAYYIPKVEGIAIMDRGYKGTAPGEMTWLANLVAGRQYPEGAATIATQYLRSPKFLQADGGYKRVVWMTETLKNFALESIPSEHRSRIQTERNVTTLDELILSQEL
jgi:acetyl-CoA decarbonylase/synthase, CODH/ACS complex subunit beta